MSTEGARGWVLFEKYKTVMGLQYMRKSGEHQYLSIIIKVIGFAD